MTDVEKSLQAPRVPRTLQEKENTKRLIVVLEDACIETVKAGKAFQLLNCDDHLSILRKNKRNLNDARPDITHQVCIFIFSSIIPSIFLIFLLF